jgi:kanamycin nucleotidyltransferase
MDHATRLALALEIASRARARFGERLLAVGVYGSLARGADGPYSDIEMLCVLEGHGEEFVYEWAHGDWKAEVDFVSRDVALEQAAELDGDWALTHGSFTRMFSLWDPSGFFAELGAAVFSPSDEAFTATIQSVIVGELYEFIGKLRNARWEDNPAYLPQLAVAIARYSAFILGLANRHLYTTGSSLLAESLSLPDLPTGYADLCRLVEAGALSDTRQVSAACEACWEGVVDWAARHQVPIDSPERIPF